MRLLLHRKFITSKIGIIFLITLFWLTADRMLEFIFPVYLEGLGKSYFEIGLLLSLTALGGLLSDWPLGNLADRASRKKMMVSSVIFSIIFACLIFVFNVDWALALLITLWGVSYQLWTVPRDALLASETDKEKRSREYGLFSEIIATADTFGPLIAGIILVYLGYYGVLGIYSIMLGIAALIVILFIKETNHKSLLKSIPKSFKIFAFVREIKEIKYLGALGLLLLFYSFVFTAMDYVVFIFEPLFCGPDGLGIPLYLAGLLMTFFSIPGIFFSYPLGILADKIGKKKVLFVGMISIGASLIMFSITENIILLFGCAALYSIGSAMFSPAIDGLIVDLSYKHTKGKIVGIWDSFLDLGYFVGPIMGGIIAQFQGLREVYLYLGIFFMAISLLLIFFVKRK